MPLPAKTLSFACHLAGTGAQAVGQLVEPSQSLQRTRVEQLAFVGQAEAAGAAVDQVQAQAALELAQVLRHG